MKKKCVYLSELKMSEDTKRAFAREGFVKISDLYTRDIFACESITAVDRMNLHFGLIRADIDPLELELLKAPHT